MAKALSLAEELQAGTSSACKLCSYLTTLTTAEAGDWQEQLRRPVNQIGHTAVVTALKRRGVDLTEVSVRRHRSRHV